MQKVHKRSEIRILTSPLELAKSFDLVLQLATTRLVPSLPRQSPVTLLPPSTWQVVPSHLSSNPFLLSRRFLCKDKVITYHILFPDANILLALLNYYAPQHQYVQWIRARRKEPWSWRSESWLLIETIILKNWIYHSKTLKKTLYKKEENNSEEIEPTDSCRCPQHTPSHLRPQPQSKAE